MASRVKQLEISALRRNASVFEWPVCIGLSRTCDGKTRNRILRPPNLFGLTDQGGQIQ